MNPSLFDPLESTRRKQDGQDQVRENAADWTESALGCLRNLALALPEFTADDLALELDRAGIGEPHHPNAYGALWSRAGALGWVAPTERTVTSKRPREHSRRIVVWVSRVRG